MDSVVVIPTFVGFFVSGVIFGIWLKEKQLKKKVLNAENIVECFRNVDWNRQCFYIGTTAIRTPDGIEHFYKAPPIDKAIERLNKLMNSDRNKYEH